MSVAREEQADMEEAVFASRHDGGAVALYKLLCTRRDEINRTWMTLFGDDLIRLQGEAARVTKLIDLIEKGPKIKR